DDSGPYSSVIDALFRFRIEMALSLIATASSIFLFPLDDTGPYGSVINHYFLD
ncbi:2922_t:CDS:1, partial [Dentiscutata heterogama]